MEQIASRHAGFAGRQRSVGATVPPQRRPRRVVKQQDRALGRSVASFFTLIFSDADSDEAAVSKSLQHRPSDSPPLSFAAVAIRTIVFPVLALLAFTAFQPAPASAQDITLRVGHFPNVTHVQALVARNFERQDKSWFAPRLGPGVKIEWYVYN